ncbi:hypothetical protein BHE74_00014669, partial [Ensete ventricosum]
FPIGGRVPSSGDPMARRSSSFSRWRYLHPAYYLKRPKRLAFLFIVFVVATFAVWDRQSLVREHEVSPGFLLPFSVLAQILDLGLVFEFSSNLLVYDRWVATSLDFNKDYVASVFETTIRVVGGLLSAYDLSGDKMFLEKAKDIADRLLPAWDTPTGIPYNRINLAHGNPHNHGWTGGESILADSGTEQLEFIALSQRTGDPKYQEKVLRLSFGFPFTIRVGLSRHF